MVQFSCSFILPDFIWPDHCIRPRTTMTQESLVNLAIMSIESDILREIDFTAVINDFAVAKSRKVPGL